MTMRYQDRIPLCQNPIARQLLTLMVEKESNLSVAADVTTSAELLALADAVGPHICVLKTHIDILDDFHPSLPDALVALAEKHRFLIFEDRKFADIGHTVKQQFSKGIYRIADWAHIVNAHLVPGPGIIEGLQSVATKRHGLLLLAEMSSKGTLATGDYTQHTVDIAQQYPDFVMGFISRRQLTDAPQFIHMTPGVSLEQSGDALGQQYLTPRQVLVDNGSDIIIVGRSIVRAADPGAEAQRYQADAWAAKALAIS